MKKIIFILVFTSLVFSEVRSQGIYGFAENHFGCFNISDREPDTLITFSGEPGANMGFRSAIDRFNGRYFFGGNIPGRIGKLHIITLGENTSIESFAPYPENVEYDFIRNRLVYESSGSLFSIDLKSMQVSFIGEIENWNNIVWGQIRTYIPQQNQFFYTRYDDPYDGDPYFLVVNGHTAEIECQTIPEEYNGLPYSPAAYVTNYFTGDIFAHRNGRFGIVNPCDGSTTRLSTISDYYSHLNNQMAALNHLDNTYVIPYYSDNNSDQYKYAIVDVYNDQVLETFSQPWLGKMGLQQIYDKPIAPIYLIHDTLFVPYGNHYKWFLNDTLISETDVNYWKPKSSGNYKAEIEFREYTTSSTETYVVYNSVSEIEINNQINIYPNPARDMVNVSVTNFPINKIQIRDLTARVVFEKICNNSYLENIDLSYLPKGIYALQIFTNSKNTTHTILLQ